MREKLPGGFEEKYRSEYLKEKIADLGNWSFVVPYNMDSKKGIKRLKENDVLFSFIDKYFPDGPFSLEPNMKDGRFVLIPEYVYHQGIGILAADVPAGFLEIGHFWYPGEYTENEDVGMYMDQVYVSNFKMRPIDELAQMVQRVYIDESVNPADIQMDEEEEERDLPLFCTFPFQTDTVVRLDGYFLDDVENSIKTIRTALKNADPMVQRNGEGLVMFMQQIASM